MSLGKKDIRRADGRQVTKEGWMLKEGGGPLTKWQNRWFRLQGKTLNYFVKKEDTNPQGTIHLDEVKDVTRIGERSGKHNCLSLVTMKGSAKKVYYFSAESQDVMNEWYIAFQANLASDAPMRLVKYATVEVFLTQGVRISGDVSFSILSTISNRVPNEKKKRDNFGWFCDRPVTLAATLNLFADYNWFPERIYRSTAVGGFDTSIHPVIRVIFSKSPKLPEPSSITSSSDSPSLKKKAISILTRSSPSTVESSGRFEGSGRFGDSVTISSQPVGSYRPSSEHLLEGADDELVSLMKEFDIPLSLLEVPTE